MPRVAKIFVQGFNVPSIHGSLGCSKINVVDVVFQFRHSARESSSGDSEGSSCLSRRKGKFLAVM